MDMEDVETYRPKIWMFTSFLWLIPIPVAFLLTNEAQIRGVISVFTISAFGFALSKVYEGVTINGNEISKRTIPRRIINISDIELCQYKSLWINNPNANDTSLFVFILKPREPKIAGLTIPRGFTISRYGWLPSDRKALFSRLKSILEQNNVRLDKKSQQKLVEAATK